MASLVAQTVKRLPAMQETRVRFLGQEDPLRSGEDQEKEMAIHSSTLAWKIPWTEEPDSLQSMGSQHTTERLHFHFKGHLADVNKSCINNQVFGPWVRKIPWRRKRQSTPALLPGKSHRQRSLIGYSPWGHKESDTTNYTKCNNTFFPSERSIYRRDEREIYLSECANIPK